MRKPKGHLITLDDYNSNEKHFYYIQDIKNTLLDMITRKSEQFYGCKDVTNELPKSLVKELEVMPNDYLAEFSDGRFSINFVVENDKLNVEVSDNGNIIDILALSSGELARVNIATLVAIRKLMTSISRSQINVLFLDEVNQALDEQGKEKVVEVLLKEENLNTYLVSHGWTHPLLEKIEIIKEENISYLNE